MDVTILNTNLDAVSIVDTYESFIWTDRYYAYGDFELYEAMREGLLDYIKQDYYLQSKESEHVMIVEKIQITSDTEDGNHVTVTGRSLESILDRRIVWGQKLLSGNLQNGIKTLLNENVISPSDSNRKISNFFRFACCTRKNAAIFWKRPGRKSRRDGERHEILFGTIDKRRDL